MVKVLELFSGTHSIGKVCHDLGYEVTSVDRDLGGVCPFGSDYTSDTHHKVDIMTWDYKQYPSGTFDIITASPVCLWWSKLRKSWVGRKIKGQLVTMDWIQRDIDQYGKPMVDKCFEIIDYFKPKYWWLENPQTGCMKGYITDKPYYDVDYCKYGLPYKKRTRFWTNIEGFTPKKCKFDCEHSVLNEETNRWKHTNSLGDFGSNFNKLEKYRIPYQLIKQLLEKCIL